MTSKEATTKLIPLIEKNGVNIPSYNNNELELSHTRHGAFLIEFTVKFDYENTYHCSATHFQPEESEGIIRVKDIEDLNVYINNELQDLTNDDFEAIEQAVLNKLDACNNLINN